MINYWLDLFTGSTWEEFINNGGNVSGFRKNRHNIAKNIKIGDYLICYLTGISRFIGVLEVKSTCYLDDSKIWKDETFPIRFKVKIFYELTPKTAIPVKQLKEKLSIFQNMKSEHAWTGFFRGSPAKFRNEDGEIILERIKNAIENPIEKDYDTKKYYRHPRLFKAGKKRVTVPESEKKSERIDVEVVDSTHEEIQYQLLKLGSDLGLDVWVAKNDRNKQYEGISFKEIQNIRNNLPRQFDEATNRTIELIDVLWLQRDAIVAAFEVEHTSTVYSGILRMSDLISMQPNLRINLFIVAPDSRREKVFSEINRPTFSRFKTPLNKICKFIPYSRLKRKIIDVNNLGVQYIKPEIVNDIAEDCALD